MKNACPLKHEKDKNFDTFSLLILLLNNIADKNNFKITTKMCAEFIFGDAIPAQDSSTQKEFERAIAEYRKGKKEEIQDEKAN